ncbi:MAG: fibronectin type III domain-containing protein, partial [Bacteroidales bacterium]|nr:fibronectin type III domain-containing protein [Bacteroidales bacterium]
MAALAVFACSPGTDLDDNTDDPQEQTDPNDQTGYEEDLTSVEADEAGHIGTDEARLYGAYSNAAGTPEELGFEWGTSADALNGKIVSQSVVSGRAGMFNAWLNNLSPDTEYYFRAYIKLAGKSYYSKVESFRTEPDENSGQQTSSYLSCYEIPATSLTNDALQSGKETWGNTNWYKYNTTN